MNQANLDIHQTNGVSPPVCLRIVSDRLRLDTGDTNLPDWIEKEIRNRNLVTGNGEIVSFCGLMAKNETDVWMFVPRGIDNPTNPEEKVRLAALVTKSIECYARQSLTKVDANAADEDFQGSEQIVIIRELLEDFRINGLYVTSSRQSTVNQGKTDWKRTISRVIPFPNAKGAPIYPVLLGSRRNYCFNNIVTTIHASIIYRLDKMFGWWITGVATGSVASDLEESIGLIEQKDYCLAMLQKELAMVYSERNLRLLNNLVKYFKHSTAAAESTVVIGLRDFHWAWEHMLGEVLPFRSYLNQNFPLPVYRLKDGSNKIAANNSMRTDIILENSAASKAVVVDAKYYAATNISNSPGWSDLVKQFFYAKALKTIKPEYDIRNVFVFPGANGNITDISVRSRDGSISHDDVFSPIHCVYACPENLMTHFIQGTKYWELGHAVFGDNSVQL